MIHHVSVGTNDVARSKRFYDAVLPVVGILPMSGVVSIIRAGGFEPVVQFFQAGLIHGWLSRRPAAT